MCIPSAARVLNPGAFQAGSIPLEPVVAAEGKPLAIRYICHPATHPHPINITQKSTLHLKRHRQLPHRLGPKRPILQPNTIRIIPRHPNRHPRLHLAEEGRRHARRLAQVEMHGGVELAACLHPVRGTRVQRVARCLVAVTRIGAGVVDPHHHRGPERSAVAFVVVVSRGQGPAGAAGSAEAVDVGVAAGAVVDSRWAAEEHAVDGGGADAMDAGVVVGFAGVAGDCLTAFGVGGKGCSDDGLSSLAMALRAGGVLRAGDFHIRSAQAFMVRGFFLRFLFLIVWKFVAVCTVVNVGVVLVVGAVFVLSAVVVDIRALVVQG